MHVCHYSGVYNEIMSFIALQRTKLDPVLVMQPHTTLQLQNIVKTKRPNSLKGTQRQFSENICSEDGLRPRIFGTFFVKLLACLPLLGFSNI